MTNERYRARGVYPSDMHKHPQNGHEGCDGPCWRGSGHEQVRGCGEVLPRTIFRLFYLIFFLILSFFLLTTILQAVNGGEHPATALTSTSTP